MESEARFDRTIAEPARNPILKERNYDFRNRNFRNWEFYLTLTAFADGDENRRLPCSLPSDAMGLPMQMALRKTRISRVIVGLVS
jgi:hypothetical protein